MAFAATESNKYISAYGASITNPSGNVVRINFNVTGTNYMSSLGASTIELYENGSLVKTFSRYNPAYTSSMVTTNALYFYSHVTYSGSSGCTYYAIVNVFASDGSGTGTESCSTGSITLP